MTSAAARRARRDAINETEGFDDAVGEDDDLAPGPQRYRTAATKRVTSLLGTQQNDPSKPPSSLRMGGREPAVAYVVAGVLAVLAIIFLTAAGDKALPHPDRVFPAIGLVLALAMAASVRLNNRIVTAIAGMASTLAATGNASGIPISVRGLSTIDLVAATGFAVWVTLRQSKARNLRLAEQRRAVAATRPARGGKKAGRKGAMVEELKGPPPSRRYTPPKNTPKRER